MPSYDLQMLVDRPNVELARAVDHALTMKDVRAAAGYLADCGAGFALICQVLADPARRRRATTTAASAAPGPRGRPPSA
jgi:bacterioferritin-associated ferredoxin